MAITQRRSLSQDAKCCINSGCRADSAELRDDASLEIPLLIQDLKQLLRGLITLVIETLMLIGELPIPQRISQGEMDGAMRRMESGTKYTPDTNLAVEAVAEAVKAKTEVFPALNGQLKDRQHGSSCVRFVNYPTRVQSILAIKRGRTG